MRNCVGQTIPTDAYFYPTRTQLSSLEDDEDDISHHSLAACEIRSGVGARTVDLNDSVSHLPRPLRSRNRVLSGGRDRPPLLLLPAALAREQGIVGFGEEDSVGVSHPKGILAQIVIGNLFNGVGSVPAAPNGEMEEARSWTAFVKVRVPGFFVRALVSHASIHTDCMHKCRRRTATHSRGS